MKNKSKKKSLFVGFAVCLATVMSSAALFSCAAANVNEAEYAGKTRVFAEKRLKTESDGAETEKEVSGMIIRSVKQTEAENACISVSVDLTERDFSKLRYIELDVTNSSQSEMPFAVNLCDKIGMKTRGFGAGTYEESVDFYALSSSNPDVTWQTKAYYGNIWIPAGFSGTVRLPYSFFKIIQDFELLYHPPVVFDYKGVKSLTIVIDQYNNPSFEIAISDVRLITPTESIVVRSGSSGTAGVTVGLLGGEVYTVVEEYAA